jgi:hypothetical protein
MSVPSGGWKLLLLMIACLIQPVSRARADDPVLARRLDQAAFEFKSARQKARETALAGFDRMINQARNGKGSSIVKGDKASEIAQARRAFVREGVFPGEPEYLSLQLHYYRSINKAYRPLARLQAQLLEEAVNEGNGEFQEQVLKAKEALEAELPGPSFLTAGSTWTGSLDLTTG